MGNKYLIWILAGVLLLIVMIPTSNPNQSEQKNAQYQQDELEQKLERVLSAMEGVGKVQVMITTTKSESSLFSDTKESQNICGVVVVAEGAGVASVNARISAAVEALFSIDAHKISIVKMASQEDDL